ncbi:DNA polymerase beta superfamily protein [Bacillus sp. Marseille-Q1617]|uniref:DNA polymerase beta superfamily protein n=1 Tax=Bacillus sp. Marseille-Q1617 TaxID=2736887 RepID=UPI001588E739|nr:nucleotidyltransferase domain-containing protein [Bacillus sp. Marseille-Q1617]
MVRILSELMEIEERYGVKILYAVEAGSRAWGYESKRSDYDIRFLYVHPVRHYLSLNHEKDVIEIHRNKAEFVGWDIKKALSLLHKSNPSIMEWLTEENIYLEYAAVKGIRKLATNGFSPFTVMNHYYQMAKKNMNLASRQPLVDLKRYLNVIRPLLSCIWVWESYTFPPNDLWIMLNELELNETFKDNIERVLTLKKKGIVEVSTKTIRSLFEEIQYELVRIENHLQNCCGKKQGNIDEFNEVFHLILEEIWEVQGLRSNN